MYIGIVHTKCLTWLWLNCRLLRVLSNLHFEMLARTAVSSQNATNHNPPFTAASNAESTHESSTSSSAAVTCMSPSSAPPPLKLPDGWTSHQSSSFPGKVDLMMNLENQSLQRNYLTMKLTNPPPPLVHNFTEPCCIFLDYLPSQLQVYYFNSHTGASAWELGDIQPSSLTNQG